MARKVAKRRQGRPVVGEASVGRDALIAAARRLLKDLPPARVTASAVAREAGADAALIRYYFGSRTALLLAVVDEMTAGVSNQIPAEEDARKALADHIRRTFQFTRSANSMQRLMIDELVGSQSPEVVKRMRDLNLGAVRSFSDLMVRDGGKELNAVDPLFLHLLIIGVADFYISAKPLVKLLAPPGSNMRDIDRAFETFAASVLLDGLRKR